MIPARSEPIDNHTRLATTLSLNLANLAQRRLYEWTERHGKIPIAGVLRVAIVFG
jgi:hypothetical protein